MSVSGVSGVSTMSVSTMGMSVSMGVSGVSIRTSTISVSDTQSRTTTTQSTNGMTIHQMTDTVNIVHGHIQIPRLARRFEYRHLVLQ
jgi:hypothetical protein